VEAVSPHRTEVFNRSGEAGLDPSAAYLKFLHHERRILFRNFK